MFHIDAVEPDPNEPQDRRVARMTARTVPWVMGTLAAGLRGEPEVGLHPSQFKALMTMHHSSVSPSELAEQLEVSLPTVSKTLGVLERRGWVERTADPQDRRRVTLAVTDEGRAAARRIMERGMDQLAEVFALAEGEELDRIEAGMESLRAVLTRAHPEHGRRHCRRVAEGKADA